MERVRRVFITFGLGAFVACGSFSDSEDAPGPAGNDAGADVAEAADGDASLPSDAGSDAPADAVPAGMVVVSTSVKSYLIDGHEVSVAEFSAYKDEVSQLRSGDAGFPDLCNFKTALGPRTPATGCAVAVDPRFPINCVDWCDAFVYCRDKGKRLCGAIAGGTVAAGKQTDPFSSQWVRACAGGPSAAVYPYGATEDNSKCNVNGSALHEVDAYPQCEGSVPGLFAMSGNVAEIDDSCVGDAGLVDVCFMHGGSAGASTNASRCDSVSSKQRNETDFLTGFRCCKDL
jgi:formylglycine-generating enzyme required for sulfatase activity